MKVLLIHNRYQQKGGEDSVVESERKMLSAHGVETDLLEADNDHIRGLTAELKAAVKVLYNAEQVARLRKTLVDSKPDVVHVHNWFPTLSPAIFGACRRSGIPVVHTLHNYRLLCIKASLYRDGSPCEDCLGTTLRLPGIVHKCYRGSRAGSAAATAAMLAHWGIGTWQSAVDRFIALSNFAKHKLIEGGLPPEKIAVKPNTLAEDPGVRSGNGGCFAYVGRFTDEKGLPIVLECWRQGGHLPKLMIIGSGPLEGRVREAAGTLDNVEYLGAKTGGEVLDVIGNARALICPSQWYEGMPRVVIEAMAVGTPVIASRLGTYLEMIEHGKSGLLFEAGRPDALLACIQEFPSMDDAAAMRASARRQFDSYYSAETNYKMLSEIYKQVIATQPVIGRYVSAARAA